MRKSALERLREQKRRKSEPLELETLDDFLKLLLAGTKPAETRLVLPTQREFIYDTNPIRGYMGPAGCAKTTTIMAAGLFRALFQPGSKGLVARFDYNDLVNTCVEPMERMVNLLPPGILIDRDKTPPMRWYIKPIIEQEGADVSTITFMGLKQYFGSYEFHWAVVDEADELDERVVSGISSRLRAYDPSNSYMLLMAFNPPSKTHWLYTACTGRDAKDRRVREPWVKLFIPRPKENIANLPTNYYEQMAASLPDDMRQRLVDGEWGSTFQGQPVYREFKQGLHVFSELAFDPYSPLFRFWDFGYNAPACIWAQLDSEGRLNILAEEIGKTIEVKPFAQRCKGLTSTYFPGARDLIDYGDPAARQKKDTGSTVAHLAQEGISLRYQLSSIDPGLRSVRQLLTRLINGEPAFKIARRCTVLVDALKGGYRMDDAGLKPFKDGYYEHPADALRYGVVNLFGAVGERGQAMAMDVSSLPGSVAYDPKQDVAAASNNWNWGWYDANGFLIRK